MGYYCTVPQCTSLAGKTKNVKFHRFPRDVTMADKWNVILKRFKPYTKYSKVCSLHFTQADYNVTTMGQWKTLSKDAVPSQNLPKLNPDGSVMVIRKSRTIKYKEGRTTVDKSEKWPVSSQPPSAAGEEHQSSSNTAEHDRIDHTNYRLQTLSAVASSLSSQMSASKPKKQDAFMQTDPVQCEDDDSQPDNSYNEPMEFNEQTGFYKNNEKNDYYKDNQEKDNYYKTNQEKDDYYKTNQEKDDYYKNNQNKYVVDNAKEFYKEKEYQIDYEKSKNDAKDYRKEDYIPQTNEEYNKEAEKYALERKSLNSYDKIDYKSSPLDYQHTKLDYMFDKSYQNRDYQVYQNGYQDGVEVLRNQQHNLELLQQEHRVAENQNFFNENHIKQEIDINGDDIYEHNKEQIDNSSTMMYSTHRTLMHHLVKQEPDTLGSDTVMQPQTSPYYNNGQTSLTGGYFSPAALGGARPGPELLIAKQNALAAHTQLWQNTMKRPFFYSESPHYAAPQLLHRYEVDTLFNLAVLYIYFGLMTLKLCLDEKGGDRECWHALGKTYVQQWTSTGFNENPAVMTSDIPK